MSVREPNTPVTLPPGQPVRDAAVAESQHDTQAERRALEAGMERQLLAAIVDSSDDAILSKTLDGIITSWNRAAEEMYGYTAAEIIGKPIWTLAPPEKKTEIDDILQRIARGERVAHHETTRLTKDGRRIEVFLTVSPLHDSAGAVIGASAIARDIAEHKRLETELAEKQRRVHDLTESIPAMVWIASASGTEDRYFNQAWTKYTGLTAEQSAGDAWQQTIHPDDRQRCLDLWKECAATGRAYETEVRYRGADGQFRWFLARAVPVRDSQGRIVEWFGTSVDIDEHKRAQHEVIEWKNRYEATIQATDNVLFDWDSQTNHIVWGGPFQQTFGHKPQDFTDLDAWISLIHPDDRAAFQRTVESSLRDRSAASSVQFRIRHSNGHYIWLQGAGKFMADPAGRPTRMVGFVSDVTARKQVEQALQESEQRFRVMTESSPAIMWKTSPQGEALYLSPRWEEVTGVPIADALGNGWHSVIHPDDQSRCAESVQRAYASGEPYQVEVRYRGRGGAYRWFLVRAVPLLDSQRHATEWLGTSFDIHDRKLAQEAERESEQRLQLASQAAGIGMFDWDMQTNQLIWSDQQLALFGLTREQIRGSYDEWQRLVHPEDLPRIEQDSREAIAARRDVENEFRIIRPDGAIRWLIVRGRIFYDHNGCPVRMLGINEDVTERKLAEAALEAAHLELFKAHEELQAAHDRVREINEELEDRVTERTYELARSEERYRELFENANDAIFTTDMNGRITSVNRAAQRITGYTRKEFLELSMEQLLLPEDKPRIAEKREEKLQRGTGITQYQVHVIAKDGRHIPAEVSTRLIMENGRPVGIQGIARDVTERKQTEEVLRQVSARLMELRDEERRRFARELHDSTGQNLAALMMNLSMLASNNGNLAPEVQRNIKESLALADACAREIRTISYLLHPPLLDEMGLESALNWLADGFAERSGVHVDLKVSAGRERMPREVELAVFRVIQEGLTNIHRHSASRTAEIRVTRSDHFIELSVTDSGNGISGWRNDEPDWSRAGVGIAGMRERVALLGGKLEIHSDTNGTTIRARLPLAKTIVAAATP